MKKRMAELLLLVLLVFGGNLAVAAAPDVFAARDQPISVDNPGFLVPSFVQGSSYLVVMATGPVDLLVTDPQGRRVGVDPVSGQVVQEIPGVYYDGPHQVFEELETESLSIPDPLSGTYSIRVIGTGADWFDLVAMVGSSWQGELLLHDTGDITLGQVIEYAVPRSILPVAERLVTYALPIPEREDWASILRLQSPGDVLNHVMVTVYNSIGDIETPASLDKAISSPGAVSIPEVQFISSDFEGSAIAESRGAHNTALLQVSESEGRRLMATEGITRGTPILYVPYLSNEPLSSTLYLLNAGEEQTDVRFTCYGSDGTIGPGATLTSTISAHAMTWVTLDDCFPTSFESSAVAESLNAQPLVGTVFLEGLAGEAALYSIPAVPSPAVYIPQVLNGAYGLQTFLQVQNTLSTTTQVVVRYYDQDGQPFSAAETRVDIPGHGAAQIVQQENPFLPAGFRGSALVQSVDGAPLTAVVIGEGGPGQDTLAAGSGFSAGSPLVALPYLSNEDRLLALQVQNLGGSSTDVVLTCYDEAGLPVYNTTTTLLPNGSASFVTATLPLPSDFSGSAVLESTGGQPLVALVWQKGITEGLSLYGGSPVGPLLVPPESIAAAPSEVLREAAISMTLSTNAPPAEIDSTTLWVRAPLSTSWASTGLVLTGTGGVFVFTPTQGDGLYRFATVAAGPGGSVEEGPAGEGDAQTRYVWAPLWAGQCACGEANELSACAAVYCAGHGTDAWTGIHTYQVEDLSAPVLGGQLSFQRTYSSYQATSATLGYGWTHRYAMRLLFPGDPGGEDEYTILVGPDGARLRYIEGENGTYTPYPGVRGTLRRVGGELTTTYVLTTTTQNVYTFDSAGALQSIADPEGRETILTYTSTNGLLARVGGPGGQRYLAFDYDGQGRMVRVRDHTNRQVTLTYDGQGDLTGATDVTGQEWSYTYTGTHLLYEVIDPNHHTVERTEYDGQGRGVRQWSGAGVQPDLEIGFDGGLTRVITDGLGVAQTILYDERNTWVGTQDAGGGEDARGYDDNFNLDSVTDANGNRTSIDWNDCGCMPERLTDALGQATVMTYDEDNHLTEMVDAQGNPTRYAYQDGRLISTTNALTQTTYYTYSAGLPGIPDGLLLETETPGGLRTSYRYDSQGQMIAMATVSGTTRLTSTYEYDDLGRTRRTISPDGLVGATFYDPAGRVTRSVQNCTAGSYEGCRTVEYDPAHPERNLVSENKYDPAGNLVLVTDTVGVATFYQYDEANRLITLTEIYDPERAQNEDNLYNVVTAYTYDGAGRQVLVTDTYGQVSKTEYDAQGRVVASIRNYTTTPELDPAVYNVTSRYGYDAAGNQVTVTNALGMVTVSEYDELNRLVTQTVNYTTTWPNPDPATYNLVTTFGYDAAGRQVTVTDPLRVRTVTEYDPLGRTVRVIRNHQDGVYQAVEPDEDVYTLYRYNAAGQQSEAGLLGLYTTTTTYDRMGRQWTVADPLQHAITSTYDAQGRLVATTDANGGRMHYGYDVLGRQAAITDALGNTTRYAYDGLGRQRAITDAAGIVTLYEYDLAGRLITVTENYSPTGPSDAQTNVRTRSGYDALGRRLWVENARGYTTTYQYDPLGRLQSETNPLTHTWSYGYDALGRRITVTDPLTVTTYRYDPLGQLLEVDYGGAVSATYAYNVLGQRMVMTDATGVTAYGYDRLGRTLAVTHTVGATVEYTVGYRYDGRGLRTNLFYPDGTEIAYSYDPAGRLTAVEGVTTTYAAYEYDDGNRLVTATLGNGVVAAYEYDAGNHLLRLTYRRGTTTLADYAYEYDSVGNRVRAEEAVRAAEAAGLLGSELESLPVAELAAPGAESGPALNAALSGALPIAWTVRAGLLAAPDPQGPSGEPIVREKDVYRASFDEQGLRYEPKVRLVEEGAYFLDFHLTQAQSGPTRLFHPGAPQNPPVTPPGPEDRVDYDRGEYLQEQYVAGAGGLEQRFVFPRPFEVQGDLEIEGNLQGNLDPVLVATTGEVQFMTPDGQTLASYGRAIVQDACGERLAATMELTGRHLRLVVPRAWLEAACFPVVVDPLIGPNFAVSTQPIPNHQQGPAVADAGSGAHLVAWYGPGSGNDVWAQVVSSDGMLISATIPLDTRSYDQQYPDVAGNTADGQFLVVWQGTTGLPVDWNIYAQRVDGTGARLGGRITVYGLSSNQQYPAVAYNTTNGEYLVVWQSQAGLTYGIYAQRVLSNGSLDGGVKTIFTSGNPLANPDVAYNAANNGYLVTWQQQVALTGWDIRGRRIDANGDGVGAEFNIAMDASAQTLPAVAYEESAGQYVVVWQTYLNSIDFDNIRGCFVPAASGLPSASFGIATGTDDQCAPGVSYSSDAGQCLVSWEQKTGSGSWDVYAARVNGAGLVAGSTREVYSGSQDQRYPAVAYGAGAVEYVVAWQDYRSGSNWDIYEQRVETDGELSGVDVLVGAQPESHAQQQAAVAYGSGSGQHLVVWTDGRNGTDDVYGQLVSAGGALVGSPIVIAGDPTYPEQSPAVAYDPVHDEYLVVWKRGVPMAAIQWIRARRVDADGTLLDSELDVCQSPAEVGNPAVAYNAALGYFLVAWEDGRNGTWDVYARAVPGGGGDWKEVEFAVSTGAYDQRVPSVAADETTGEYLVAWQTGSATSADVYGRLTTATATPRDSFALSTAANDQLDPAVAWNAETGEYLAVWSHDNGSDDDVHGRRVSGSGALLGEELTLASGSAAQQYPAVAADAATAGYLVAWQQGSSNADVPAAVLNYRGQNLGAELTLAAAANTQQQPALSYDAATGRVLAVWADYRNSASYPDVYAQLYQPLQADFSGAPTSGAAELEVSFTGSATPGADTWAWTLGDGGTSTDQNPTHQYAQAGVFTVTLQASDSTSGEVGERVRGAYVLVSPVADLSGTPTSGAAPLNVSFTDNSTPGVDAWAWDLGDGSTSTEQNPSHPYTRAGVFDVTLRVTDTHTGLWDERVRTVYITASPVAAFSGAPLTGTAPLAVQFTDGSTPGVEAWYWRFGDGTTGTAPSPDHLYTEAGAFTVTLQVTDTDTGEWDELARPSYVTVAPLAGFSAAPPSGPLPLAVSFTGGSTPGVDEWDWSFGDGGVRTATSPVYTYTWVGAFTVTLRVMDTDTGEGAVATGTVTVTPLVIDYRYDPLGRLTAAEYNSGVRLGYRYDAMSNWLTKTETTPLSGTVVTTYTYNAGDQLVTVRSSADGIVWHYTFDDRGNLLRQTPGGTVPANGETRYTYDAAGQLVQVELYVSDDYTTLATAAYNGVGERARLTTWAAGTPLTVTYVSVNGLPLATESDSQRTLYLYGHGSIAERETAWAYDLQDGAGSVRQIVDESGAVTLTRAYKPFGETMTQSGGYQTAFGFLGAQLDRVSGLLYAGGRYYDPATGRFLTPGQGSAPYRLPMQNPYVPLQSLTFILLISLAVVTAITQQKKRNRKGPWLPLLLLGLTVGLGVSIMLSGCVPITPTPGPPPAPLPAPPELPPPYTPTPKPSPMPIPELDLIRHSVRLTVCYQVGCSNPDDPAPCALEAKNSSGTLIELSGRKAILAHNHWRDDDEVGFPGLTTRIDLANWVGGDGNTVTVPYEDISLVEATDPSPDYGTMVFFLPENDSNLNRILNPALVDPAELGNASEVQPGSWVQAVLFMDRGAFYTLETQVLYERKGKGGAPIMVLRDEDKTVLHGDSGGGVFYKGNLVGNMWQIWPNRPEAEAALLPSWVKTAAPSNP